MNFLKVNLFTLILIFYQSFSIAQSNKPNIIYIMADDLGYADLSCYGRKDYKTPNLDKLCSQGVKFMNAYAAAPVCTPTRVAFMTGRYPARLQVGLYEPIAEGNNDSAVGLSPQIPSIARLMKKGGYETYLVGKWHLGYPAEYSPNRNGFDYFYGFHAGAIDYISHSHDLYENETAIEKPGYTTDMWADKSIELIRKKHSKPFFLAVMFNAPHWPWQGPGDKAYPEGFDNWTKNGTPEIYVRMMISLDNAVGRIVKAVDSLNMSKNTVIIFTSDNGGERFSDNGIYKGSKMSLWEGGIREPAFVRWTGKIKENSVSNQVVTTMDWTATILSVAGGKANPQFPLDGIDVMPIITGKKKEVGRTLYWRISQRKKHNAMRDGNWKYMKDEKGNEYLFDLAIDPQEKNDLKAQENKVFKRLKSKYKAWEAAMLKPIPLPGAK
ncbi:MAG TPA: sulfatase-like hydrolase/transferase [Chitinophagaceae bacterium]|nr:sulfatase-like hydrolase/transferase [Chitinophagaceae bacterium]